MKLNKPVVGMAVDRSTGGYWLVASDEACSTSTPFDGATGGTKPTNRSWPSTPSPTGAATAWWPRTVGSSRIQHALQRGTGLMRLNRPVVTTMVNNGDGYWLVASDGGAVLPSMHRSSAPPLAEPGCGRRLERTGARAGRPDHRRAGRGDLQLCFARRPRMTCQTRTGPTSALTFFPFPVVMVIAVGQRGDGNPSARARLKPMALKSANGDTLHEEPLQVLGASAIHSAEASWGWVRGVWTLEQLHFPTSSKRRRSGPGGRDRGADGVAGSHRIGVWGQDHRGCRVHLEPGVVARPPGALPLALTQSESVLICSTAGSDAA